MCIFVLFLNRFIWSFQKIQLLEYGEDAENLLE